MVQHVHLQIRLVDEAFVARRALHLRLRLVVANGVELQRALRLEELPAHLTRVRLVGAVRVLRSFFLRFYGTLEGFRMAYQMFLKIRGHREAAMADGTLERLLAGVRASVQDELVAVLEGL